MIVLLPYFVILSITPHSNPLVHAFIRASAIRIVRRQQADPIAFLASNNDNIPENEAMYTDPEDDELIKELRETKRDMYGVDIPITDELWESTQNAENEFLAAMLVQSREFKQIKREQGSERAMEIFMERIKAEENPVAEEAILQSDEDEDDKGSRFVEKMYEEQNPGVIIDNEDSTSWQ